MGKLEIEVKLLNIDIELIEDKIFSLGGKFVEEINQELYTYDLPTIYGRFLEILFQLNNPESNIKFDVALSRLKTLFYEIDNLQPIKEESFMVITKCKCCLDLVYCKNFMDVINQQSFISYIKQFEINPNKWVRLRKSGDIATIAIKHILANHSESVQKIMETEIEVSSFEVANDLLQQLGFSYKSYQEKKRKSFILKDFKIDIDFWPGIPAFMEIEGKTEEDLKYILNLLGYSLSDTVSCTADEIYRLNGKNMFESRELKFAIENVDK